MRKRFLAIDFDGVIADSLPIALEEYQRLLSSEFPSVPVPRTVEDLAYVFSGPLRTSLRRFGIETADSTRFFDLHSSAMRARQEEVRLFCPVAEALLRLPQDRCAIVTSSYGDAVRSVLARHGFGTAARKLVVLGREMGLRKSEKITLLASRARIPVSQVVKVGDMVSDILYARYAGACAWAAGWGYHPFSYLQAFGPDECFRTQDEFTNKLQGLWL